MRSVIICEGSTDLILLQYFLRTAHLWNDTKEKCSFKKFKNSRMLKKGEDLLILGGGGGCSQIPAYFNDLLESNTLSAKKEEKYDKIVIITDRDEIETEQEFIEKIKGILKKHKINFVEEIKNDQWVSCRGIDGRKKDIEFQILLLVIPFEETGAMETFLLNAIGTQSDYDKTIIEKCSSFVERIDPEERYLKKRRYKTKAKFDTYFSVRTAVDQFVERQNILKSVKWEEYSLIQESFKKLEEL